MSQPINDNYEVLAGIPIDSRNKKATISERDGISATLRYQGLQCFVEQTQTLYQLQGGIANSNWVGIAGANSSNALETIIDGFYVLLAGKTTILDWEVGDKFRGWIDYRYVVGTIISLPVSLPGDINTPSKVLLSIDSDAIVPKVPKIQFTADGIQDTFDIGILAEITSVFCNGALLNDLDWSQTGTEFTLTFTPDSGALIKPI